MATIAVGQIAPDFSLVTHDGGLFTLSEAVKKSPVVLVFYTMDGSPTCIKLLCRINEDLAQFASHGFQLVGVNNAEQEIHFQTAKRKFLRLPLLSDDQFRVARAYDSIFEIGPIKVIRYSVVGIGTNGRIIYRQRGKPTNKQIIDSMVSAAA